jgi:hypothetical protein
VSPKLAQTFAAHTFAQCRSALAVSLPTTLPVAAFSFVCPARFKCTSRRAKVDLLVVLARRSQRLARSSPLQPLLDLLIAVGPQSLPGPVVDGLLDVLMMAYMPLVARVLDPE